VDTAAFAAALPGAFDDFPHSATPRDPLFEEILEEVGGLAKPNNLALIATATTLLPEGESYVEVGSFKGASLVAASYGKQGDFVGIDDFSMGEGGRALLERNLAAFGSTHATILEGDAFDTLRGGALAGRRVGIYYYDAGHSYEQQLEGLRLIEPHLAGEALVIVDDSDWERVEQAVRDYLAEQPRANELLRIGGKRSGRPWWWEGVAVLAWHAQSK
jgi:precorrin-6B methylase 2